MYSPIPGAGLGAARSCPEPGLRRNRHRLAPVVRAKLHTFFSLIEAFAHKKDRLVAGDSHDGLSPHSSRGGRLGGWWEAWPTGPVAPAANHGEEGPMGHPLRGGGLVGMDPSTEQFISKVML